jgi:uncharacterized protein YfaS (alpha-2-macroglobulin family)
VPLPIEGKGVYIVEAVSGPAVARTLVIKSDLSCVIKQSSRQTLVFAAHAVTGAPVAGAGIALYGASGAGAPLAAKTGASGTYLFEQAPAASSLVIVTSGGEFAVSDPNFYATSFFGEGGLRTYQYTERPVYRPGDEVSFKGIVRRYRDGSYSPVAGNGEVEVYDTEGAPSARALRLIFRRTTAPLTGRSRCRREKTSNSAPGPVCCATAAKPFPPNSAWTPIASRPFWSGSRCPRRST